ncbi:MAG: MFS transporter, partial [Oscillospiraceae bacterium]|nr:MFS transporter [Oscillospiraceae bacterium]
MKNTHYHWLVCAGCTLIMFCTVGLATTAFSVYQPYIIEHGHMTNTQGSAVITVRSFFGLLPMFFVEKYLKKLGLRMGIVVAALGTAAAFAFYAAADSFPGYCVGAAFAGMFYGLGGLVPVSILISRWFVGHRATAMGISATGSGAATILTPPLISAIAEKYSLAAAFTSEAVFCLASALFLFIVLRNSPAERGLVPLPGSGSDRAS